MRRLLLAFFASGASGLVLEITWVRQLGHLLGNTTQSAALVTAVFVVGLGAGALIAGVVADRMFARRSSSVVRAYAALELFIAAWALALAFLLPALCASPFPPSSYTTLADGWHVLSGGARALQILVAGALLLPPSLAMGATLVVIVRSLARGASIGLDVALVYTANTAGASLGALGVDLLLVPSVGVIGAQACAVALNLVAALIALQVRGALDAQPPAPVGAAPPVAGPRRGAPIPLLAAVSLAGAVGMALEIVWLRYLTSVLGAHRATLSLILATILVGMWCGSAVVGWAATKTARPLAVLAGTLALLVVASVGGMLAPLPADHGSLARMWVVVVIVVGPASLCLGTSFPLANAAVAGDEHDLGWRAASFYFANTAGGLVGALGAGFVLIPSIGMQASVAVILGGAVVALVLVGALVVQRGTWGARMWTGAAILASCAALAVLAAAPHQALLERIYARADVHDHVIRYGEGVDGSIAITERLDLGDEPQRVLYVDGALMSGTLQGPQRYMRLMAHLPLLLTETPRRALVICFGVGNTAQAVSLHPTIERIDIADLSRQILERAGDFARWNGSVLEDPRVQVFVDDGRHHLRVEPPDTYDLVTLEPPPIAQAGVGALYAEEFYALARSRLRPGGFLTQWLPAYQVTADAANSMVHAFVDVFPDAVLIVGWEKHLILVGRKDMPNEIDPVDVARRLAARPAVSADLARFEIRSPRDLLGLFVADGATLSAATMDAPPASDDWPVSEYAVSFFGPRGSELDPALFDVGRVAHWCPRCALDPALDDALKGDLAAAAPLYQSEAWRLAR